MLNRDARHDGETVGVGRYGVERGALRGNESQGVLVSAAVRAVSKVVGNIGCSNCRHGSDESREHCQNGGGVGVGGGGLSGAAVTGAGAVIEGGGGFRCSSVGAGVTAGCIFPPGKVHPVTVQGDMLLQRGAVSQGIIPS